MTGIYLILPTLLVILFSFLMVRAAAIAFMMTGMDEKKARFQASSAFSGTGFTTKEAELIVNHPRRRQIATWLMILGNAGIVTVIVTATSSIVTSTGYQLPISILVLAVGIYIIYRLTSRTSLGLKWEKFVQQRLIKAHVFDEGTTEDLLHLLEGYGLIRATITKNSDLIGHSAIEVNTAGHEFMVMGIERGRDWLSFPRSRELINEGDRLVVYGDLTALRQMFKQD